MMSYLTGQNPDCRGAAGVDTLPRLTAAAPVLRRKHSPWLCTPVTPDPTVLSGVNSFYCTHAETKAFPVRVSEIVTLSKLFPCSLRAFNTSQKWNISGCKSKGGSKAHRKSLLGSDLTWSGLLSFFMSSPAANISQWNAPIWQYPEGKVDYCSSKLHTATEERDSDGFTFFMWCYFITYDGLMKIKSWCTTVTILPLSQSFTLTFLKGRTWSSLFWREIGFIKFRNTIT